MGSVAVFLVRVHLLVDRDTKYSQVCVPWRVARLRRCLQATSYAIHIATGSLLAWSRAAAAG